MKYFIYVPLRHEEVYATVKKYAGHRLHHHGLMYDWWYEPERVRNVAIAFNERFEAIGASMVLKTPEDFGTNKYDFGVFVKNDYRSNGIGGRLVSALRHTADGFYCDNTSERKKQFFTKYLDGKNVNDRPKPVQRV